MSKIKLYGNIHNWMLISEEQKIDGKEQVFKCINCLLTYKKFIPKTK